MATAAFAVPRFWCTALRFLPRGTLYAYALARACCALRCVRVGGLTPPLVERLGVVATLVERRVRWCGLVRMVFAVTRSAGSGSALAVPTLFPAKHLAHLAVPGCGLPPHPAPALLTPHPPRNVWFTFLDGVETTLPVAWLFGATPPPHTTLPAAVCWTRR